MTYISGAELRDNQLNKRINGSPLGELRVEGMSRVVGESFVGSTIDTNVWTSTVANSGTNTQANGLVTVRTNTTANGQAVLASAGTARYIAGTTNYFRGVIRLGDTGTTNNVRRWGAFDANNGFFFDLTNSTFSVVTRKTTVDTAVASGSFNGSSLSYSLDTNAHVYEIFYTDHKVYFFIDDVLIHTVTASSTTVADTLSLKLRFENTNVSSSTTDLQLAVRSAVICRIGKEVARPKYYNLAVSSATPVVLKYGPGTLDRVIINKKGASGNTLTIYDNTSAFTVVAAIDTETTIGSLNYGIDLYTGLTIVLNGGASAADVTIVYN
jgi:hypothetical protein